MKHFKSSRMNDTANIILALSFLLFFMLFLGSLQKINDLKNEIESLKYELTTSNTTNEYFNPIDQFKTFGAMSYNTSASVQEEDEEIYTNEPEVVNITTENVYIQKSVPTNVVVEDQSQVEVEESEEKIVYYDTGIYYNSGLSEEQIDEVINLALEYYGRTPEEYAAHNLGYVFKEAENKYNVNALYLIAISQRESGFNTSDMARQNNNITSICNSKGSLRYFNSIEENILETARLLGETYRDQWGKTNLYEVSLSYNPVNDEWDDKVQDSVNTYYMLLNEN